jgi:hypothetical protein
VEDPRDTALWRLINLQPAVWRGLVVAVLALAATLGFEYAADLPDNVMLLIIGILPILQALYTRKAVTPNAKVAVSVPDPVRAPNKVEAGEAVVNAPDEEIVAAAASEADY